MNDAAQISLIYDGNCPVCTAYCKAIALRALDPNFQIIDARSNHPLIDEVKSRRIDMDEGFVLIIGQEFYRGAEAIHTLAFMTSRSGILNKFNFMIFRSKRLSFMLYPLLRAGRNTLLWLLRRKKLN